MNAVPTILAYKYATTAKQIMTIEQLHVWVFALGYWCFDQMRMHAGISVGGEDKLLFIWSEHCESPLHASLILTLELLSSQKSLYRNLKQNE